MKNRNDLPWHYTASGYVFNPERTKLLLIFHKKIQKWLPPGGHLDAGELPHEAVIREIKEESCIDAKIIEPTKLADVLDPDIEIEIPTSFTTFDEIISAHGRDEEHRHIDLSFLLEADESDAVHCEKETDAAEWFTLEQVRELDTFDSVKLVAEKVMKK